MTTIIQHLTTFDTDTARWNAMLNRDLSAIGQFVLAVKTTGIYCRPGCPAKTPKRENCLFFDSPNDAEHAGFRACKRCHPDDPDRPNRDARLIRAACEAIENSDHLLTLDELASTAGFSKHHFHRLFKKITGITPGQYARSHRANKVREELAGSPSVTDVIYDSGYGSSGRFYASTDAAIGMKPTTYRDGGKGETIRFAIAETSLGAMLVASTAKGICSIAFDDAPEVLIGHLQQRFANAELIGDDPAYQQTVAQVIASVESPGQPFDLPLDLRGTAFQHRVWNALREIPAGTTLTYSQVAERINSPKAVRAVASACANNNVAVIVPCHRVVRKNGELGGYRWGLDRKQELLRKERT